MSEARVLRDEKVAAPVEAGYAVAAHDYRLSGEALFPAAVQDVKAGVQFLLACAGGHGLDPERDGDPTSARRLRA